MSPADDRRERLLETLEHNRSIASRRSPFYEGLLEHMAADVREGGPTWGLLERWAAEPPTEYYPFRALAGVHLEVLDGTRPELAEGWPAGPSGGDPQTAWPGVREAFAQRDPEVLGELRHPLQTNEPSRCGALIGGFCAVARATALPLRVLELGASAGLNLNFDRYRYEAGGAALGPPESEVRFVDYWQGGAPDLGAPLEVRDRRGCDLAPLDPSAEGDRLQLEADVWPDEGDRMSELRAASAIAAADPPAVDRASADEWAERMLAEPAPGVATVVYHSVFWPYLPAAVAGRIEAALAAAGERATAEAPLAWLRYEPGDEPAVVELRLGTWPAGAERLLARGGHHREPVHWLG